jgi:hypothetical protein
MCGQQMGVTYIVVLAFEATAAFLGVFFLKEGGSVTKLTGLFCHALANLSLGEECSDEQHETDRNSFPAVDPNHVCQGNSCSP